MGHELIMSRKTIPLPLLLPLLLAFAASGCVGPHVRAQDARAIPSSKPGWGRTFAPPEPRMTVRAVEASAKPSTPPTQLGKPGWGRN